MKKKHNKYCYGVVSFEEIQKAISGDFDSITRVLQHYSGYIKKLSSRNMYQEGHTAICFVDTEMENRLRSKLTKCILRFKLTK